MGLGMVTDSFIYTELVPPSLVGFEGIAGGIASCVCRPG